ncbi:MAG TPA: orotate phosphoribosyltransferase [Firmicutes bacterium]|nr:orotate phosphoribosyltransferase [Bacillota bacterium]
MKAGTPMGVTEIMAIFNGTGALRQGHFVLTSGKHSAQYMQCAQVLQYPWLAATLGEALAAHYAGVGVETVVGPAMGGILVAHEVGRALGVRALFAERQDGKMTLRRGFTLKPGEKVLVVEDVITTGGSVQEVIDLVKDLGAEPVGVGVLVDRSGGRVTFAGLPLHSLLSLQIEAFALEECPLCAQGIPWEKPGSRGNA